MRNELLILINYLMNDEKALFYFYEKQNVPSVQSPAAFLGFYFILLNFSKFLKIFFYFTRQSMKWPSTLNQSEQIIYEHSSERQARIWSLKSWFGVGSSQLFNQTNHRYLRQSKMYKSNYFLLLQIKFEESFHNFSFALYRPLGKQLRC